MTDLIQCPECAAKVTPTRFCSECGAKLQRPAPAPSTPSVNSQNEEDFSRVLAQLVNYPKGTEYGYPRDQYRALIPRAGGRVNELAARFVNIIKSRALPGVDYYRGGVGNVPGLHICLRKKVGGDAAVNMLVRFYSQGSDALVGWRRCENPGKTGPGCAILIFCATVFFLAIQTKIPDEESILPSSAFGRAAVVALILSIGLPMSFSASKGMASYDDLPKEPWAEAIDLQLSVKSALAEAIDHAQLTDLVQPLDNNQTAKVI